MSSFRRHDYNSFLPCRKDFYVSPSRNALENLSSFGSSDGKCGQKLGRKPRRSDHILASHNAESEMATADPFDMKNMKRQVPTTIEKHNCHWISKEQTNFELSAYDFPLFEPIEVQGLDSAGSNKDANGFQKIGNRKRKQNDESDCRQILSPPRYKQKVMRRSKSFRQNLKSLSPVTAMP